MVPMSGCAMTVRGLAWHPSPAIPQKPGKKPLKSAVGHTDQVLLICAKSSGWGNTTSLPALIGRAGGERPTSVAGSAGPAGTPVPLQPNIRHPMGQPAVGSTSPVRRKTCEQPVGQRRSRGCPACIATLNLHIIYYTLHEAQELYSACAQQRLLWCSFHLWGYW